MIWIRRRTKLKQPGNTVMAAEFDISKWNLSTEKPPQQVKAAPKIIFRAYLRHISHFLSGGR